MTARFTHLPASGSPSAVGVLIIPGAGWGASALGEESSSLTGAGHEVLLCDPPGSTRNPGPFTYDALLDAVVDRVSAWGVRRIIAVAHSMGAWTSTRLAHADARVEQLWAAPILDGRACFRRLYAGAHAQELHGVLLGPQAETLQPDVIAGVATDAWLDPAVFASLAPTFAVPSKGAVRVPEIAPYLQEVALPGYAIAPDRAIRLRGALVARDDAWVDAEALRAFCAAVGAPVSELHDGRGHAVLGGWFEVLQIAGAIANGDPWRE